MERSPQWPLPPPPTDLVKYFFSLTRKFTKETVIATTLLVSCGGGSGGGGGAAGGQAYSPLSCTVDWDCPASFVPVCGNPVLGTSDFCVMKFEAKDVSGVATSQAAGGPWGRSSELAYSACSSLTATNFDGDFSLISNREWMTVARAIEAVASNWSGNSVGSGHLARGHSDGLPASYLPVTDEDDLWNGTQQDGSEAGGSGWEQRRTHTLPGGGVVWDFAGNYDELVDWDASDTSYTGLSIAGISSGTKEFSAPLEGGLTAGDVLPAGSYTSAQSAGIWGSYDTSTAVIRGGGRSADTRGGIFALYLGIDTGDSSGFRCVYLP